MDRRLREPLNQEQTRLITTVYQPFADTTEWPLWGYVTMTLDRQGIDAGAVLRSLPQVRHPDPAQPFSRYGLSWHQHPGWEPRDDQPIALTVAGLRHLPAAEPLLGAFIATIALLDQQIRELPASPHQPIDTTIPVSALADRILTASIGGSAAPPVDTTMRKLRQLFQHEHALGSMVQGGEDWQIHIGWASVRVLRELRGVRDVEEYLDRVIARVAPDAPPTVPLSFSALDLPYALGYLDAVWRNALRSPLFANLDPASIARLTQPCGDEGDFNSLMSALADTLSRAVPPGQTRPRQGGALETVRDDLVARVDPAAADRIRGAFDTLLAIRRIRVAAQHSDARHKAVEAFRSIGLSFPPAHWSDAWQHIIAITKGALDVLREEVNAAFADRDGAAGPQALGNGTRSAST